ncbi:hypothetical protein [Clostridium sp. Marseille-P2415]|uniref:hypothetical protein n=1 Tax=Clostridium sp. Marseille-P2415 TaxID=1805471 RepID=UPI00098890D1|nr:hypothetical protein [Clostridium sp. Marseille-P2415]
MDINEFAILYPELYSMIVEDVSYAVDMNQITGEESLRDWDNLVDSLVKKYEQAENMDENMAQQFPGGFGDRDDRDRRRRRRRRFRDHDLRDLFRIIFLRRLFDRDRY